jgi:type III secretion protein J
VPTACIQQCIQQVVRCVGRVGLLVLCVIGLAACNLELYANLDQRQANDIVATLFRQGIPAERVRGANGKYAVNVDGGRFAEAVSVLNDHGLPKQDFASLGEVFKNDGIVASPVQERAQMIYALSQELARTISDIDGVLTSRVHLVLPENDPLRQQLIPSSASVFIRHLSNVAMADLVPQVKLLVANGIAGLSYDKVSVVLLPVDARIASGAAGSTPELVSFLGLWLHPDSLTQARLMVYGLLAAVLVGCAAAGYWFWNRRQRVYTLPVSAQGKAP